MTLAKFAYWLATTAYGRGKIAGFSGDTAMPTGRVPRGWPARLRLIQRSTRLVRVSTDATRQSGYPSRPGSVTYSLSPLGVRATAFGQLRNGCLTNGQCCLPLFTCGL